MIDLFCRSAPDHDDFGSIRSKIMNVIDSYTLEHDVVRKPLRTFRHHALLAIVAAVLAFAAPASAQQPRPAQPAPQQRPPVQAQPAPQAPQPSASAVALAREILVLKGSTNILDPLVVGVVEQTKNMFMQTNFAIGKDINEVALELRKELAPRRDALIEDIARMYAQRFTEQEIKDTLTFYNSPLGKKLITEEPQFVDQSLQYAQNWANRLSEEVINKFRAAMKKRGHDL